MAEVFTNDWVKWAVVFIVLIGTFIISMKILKKIGYVLPGEKNVDKAKAKDMVYYFFIFIPFALAALTAMVLEVSLDRNGDSTWEDPTEEVLETGAWHEGSLTYNGITVDFKTPEVGTGGGEYDWCTYYTDEKGTDVKVEFGFVDELPPVPEGNQREDCVLWGKDMLYETTHVPDEEDGHIQEQLFAYWQLAEDTYFMIVITGEGEELSKAYSRLLEDEKFQNSFEISSRSEN